MRSPATQVLRAQRGARFRAAAELAVSRPAPAAPVARTSRPSLRPPPRPATSTPAEDLRTRRFMVSVAVRLGCVVAAVALPLPLLARLALMVASIVLSWGAVLAFDAGTARRDRRGMHGSPAPSSSSVAAGGRPESVGYRVRWRLTYGLLQAYGPAQLNGADDPREQMRTERALRRLRVPAGGHEG